MQNQRTTLRKLALIATALTLAGPAQAAAPGPPATPPERSAIKEIKAYCIDFNWAPTQRRGRPLAKPGQWAATADPAAHVAWYQSIGANVIQTFCVATNGHAWYHNSFAPVQPGLKHDFLPEVVRLGHQKGLLVFGYFCIATNPVWGELHPELSYGTPATYHIPYTDEYLDYLSKSISDAVKKTGIDGFMIDWVWQPNRQATGGKWIEAEKRLYAQLTGEPFPGEDKLTKEQDTAYSRKAIDRCWKAIRKAAKDANPDCIIWLTVNHINHPHVTGSDMYQEADWLMNEAGSMQGIEKVRSMVGEHTRLITCMALWNGQDAAQAVPQAAAAGVGLYGFTYPRTHDGLIPLEPIFTRQVSELSGDERNIAVLARAYHGVSPDALWQDGRFVEPAVAPPFRIGLKGRGRGLQDTAVISHEQGKASATITTPYDRGRAQLVRSGENWPGTITIRLQKRPGQTSAAMSIKAANGVSGFHAQLDCTATVNLVPLDGELDLGREWGDRFPAAAAAVAKAEVKVDRTGQAVEITLPGQLTAGNPKILTIEW
ncbi:MAG: hypothetical protein MUF04_07020, partial [Akkermansiaceae bacterium]|nr:hypothetical protein [Akkermansiaceae bacterium]